MQPRRAPTCTSRRVSFASAANATSSSFSRGTSSARPRRSVFATCPWTLINPGSTAQSVQSISSSAPPFTAPTAAIFPCSMSRSPRTTSRFGFCVTIHPPRRRSDTRRGTEGRGITLSRRKPFRSVGESRAVDIRRELESLLAQIPRGRVAHCGDIARALGDVRASAAVFRFVREHPDLAGAYRVVTQGGRTAVEGAARELRAEGWRDDLRPFAGFHGTEPLAGLRAEQRRIASKVSRRNGFRKIRTVGGVDVAYADGRGFASLVVLDAHGSVEEEVLATREIGFPYIPTYLAYREFPIIEAAFHRLREPPTALLVDGHGQLHPARCGIACMVGVELDVPTIGVAKNPLVGTPDHRPRIGAAFPVR